MESQARPDLTQLLLDWRGGDKAALDQLIPFLYDELRRLASSHLRRQAPGHTLRPTALVNEAYLRLADQSRLEWRNRAHFFGIAAQVMRNIIIDHARRSGAGKRGGGAPKLSLDESFIPVSERPSEVVALDDALKALALFDERKARSVELRYFGGLSNEEIAEVLGTSLATVGRDLRAAEAWLYRELNRADEA